MAAAESLDRPLGTPGWATCAAASKLDRPGVAIVGGKRLKLVGSIGVGAENNAINLINCVLVQLMEN